MAKPGRPETDLEILEDVIRNGTTKIESYLRRIPQNRKLYLNKIETTLLLMAKATENFRWKK